MIRTPSWIALAAFASACTGTPADIAQTDDGVTAERRVAEITVGRIETAAATPGVPTGTFTVVSASFGATIGRFVSCAEVARDGGCVVQSCAPASGSGPSLADAGELHVVLPGLATPLALAYDPLFPNDSGYAASSGAPLLTGSRVDVGWTGSAAVPRGELGATVPSDAELTSPSCASPIGCDAIDRTAALAVAWTAASPALEGRARITLASSESSASGVPGASTVVTCTADLGTGAAIVPAALLAHLAPTNLETRRGTLSFDAFTESTLAVGGWDVKLTVTRATRTSRATFR